MLPLDDCIATVYKTAARIKIMRPEYDLLKFLIFDCEMALKSQPASETPSPNRAWDPRNINDFFGFISSRDEEAKLMISYKF